MVMMVAKSESKKQLNLLCNIILNSFDKHGSKQIDRYDDGNVRSFRFAIKIICEILILKDVP